MYFHKNMSVKGKKKSYLLYFIGTGLTESASKTTSNIPRFAAFLAKKREVKPSTPGTGKKPGTPGMVILLILGVGLKIS